MHPLKRLLLAIAVYCFFTSTVIAQKQPVSIIFDTDMGPDYDDVGAMAMLHAMADKGECRILATVASNRHPWVAADLNVLNTYFGRPDIPIGVVSGKCLAIPAIQGWDSLLAKMYPHKLSSNDEAENAVTLYRKLLAAADNHSVTIVTVGFFTNMANLLLSPGDQYSSLDGASLVNLKVKQLVSMAGRFDGQQENFREFNVKEDAAAAEIVFNRWPVPILFSGFEIGAAIHTGLPVVHNAAIQHSPVKDVFARCIPMDPNDKNGRMSWDETAVLVAVRGLRPWFKAVSGQIISHPDGSNGWNPRGTRDKYLVRDMPVPAIEKILNELIMQQPTAKSSN